MSLDRNQVSSQRLLVHKEQWKQQSNVSNMFKVNTKTQE